MRALFFLVISPFLLVGQAKLLRLHAQVECDTIFSKSGNWRMCTVTEQYQRYSPEEDDELVEHSRSAIMLFNLGEMEPLLIESTLLIDTTEEQVLNRLSKKVKLDKLPIWPDTMIPSEDMETLSLTPLGNDIFEITQSAWQYYTGAAHGAGSYSVTYFKANSRQFFGFEDVLDTTIYPFIQKKLKENIRTDYPEWEFDEVEVDSIAAQNYSVTEDNYAFTKEGLDIHCQMYCNFYGWLYIGYSFYGFTIPWAELTPYLLPNHPLTEWLAD